VEVHICSDRSGYRFTFIADGVENQLYEGTRSEGWAGRAAMRRLKIAPEADWERCHALPKIHEAEELPKKDERDWIGRFLEQAQARCRPDVCRLRRDRQPDQVLQRRSTWR
jgi:hypothetical protein